MALIPFPDRGDGMRRIAYFITLVITILAAIMVGMAIAGALIQSVKG